MFEAIQNKSTALGCSVLAVNGTADPIHVAVCIPPKLAIMDWVKLVKGVSSHDINASMPESQARFRWQNGFGVLSFGVKQQEMIVSYILNQKEHHANGTIQLYMERTDD